MDCSSQIAGRAQLKERLRNHLTQYKVYKCFKGEQRPSYGPWNMVQNPYKRRANVYNFETASPKAYKLFYYIKVSGIPSRNKLIKTIRYPHMWKILKFVGVSSKYLRVFLVKVFSYLRQSSEILGKCWETFVWPLEQFWKIFGNLR